MDKKVISNQINDEVFNQSCSQYLKHMNINAEDAELTNCPFRADSDSGAFSINGPLWHDFPTGQGGNVWQLALKLNNDDKAQALKTLYDSAGVPFIENERVNKILTDREKALAALKRIRQEFSITKDKTPEPVWTYLEGRKVTATSLSYFAFIPPGRLSSVLSEEEIRLTGLREREGLILFWYLKAGEPVYYCTRNITTKAFKKAAISDEVLEHPIWNIDALYRDENVVWGEGMFDCASLIELGYSVAGEITCHLHNAHAPQLLTALRWRLKNHPDWTFTICLDNDKPGKDGRRPGNDAAEKMAVWLWGNGVDVRWVKHDPTSDKVDINLLHQNGLGSQVQQIIDGAKPVSSLLPADEKLCLRNFTRMIAQSDFRGAHRILDLLKTLKPENDIAEIIEKTHHLQWNWRDVYTQEIQDIFLFNADVYVFFNKDAFGIGEPCCQVFKKNDFVKNMERFQLNPCQEIKFTSLDIIFKRPTWRVEQKMAKDPLMFNLFKPSALFMQEPKTDAPLPEMWEKVLDNLAGPFEKEWLLNHMAVYVQTRDKPRAIPVLVGAQGTGKTVLSRLFGEGIGGYIGVGNSDVESQFNGYLMNPVVLLDELANNQRESNLLKNKLKSFINEKQTINMKHREPFSISLNNYIIIASNEQTTHVPLIIERNDRRYCIITGGQDKDLAHEGWYDYRELEASLPRFMLHLLSRPINVEKASIPLASLKKQQLTEQGENFLIQYVRQYIETRRTELSSTDTMTLTALCDAVDEKYKLPYKLTSWTIKPILQHLGYSLLKLHNQAAIRLEPWEDGLGKPTEPTETNDPNGISGSNTPFSQ